MNSDYPSVSNVIEKLKPSEPLYCLSRRNIWQRSHLFQAQFSGTVAWAVKSNPSPLVAQTIHETGISDFDVASLAEIKLIKQNCPGARLHFNHPVKAPEAIQEAYYKYGVRNFVVDHEDEITKIANYIGETAGTTLLIRFYDPSIIPSSNYDFGKKFGAPPAQAAELLIKAKAQGFKTGIAFHPSTQYHDPSIYGHLLGVAKGILRTASAHSAVCVERVNMGGGFPAYYPDEALPAEQDYFAVVRQAVMDAQSAFSANCEFICEPGRAMVADCASLIARVELNRGDGRLHLNDGFYGALMEQQFVDFSPPARAYSQDGKVLTAANDAYTLIGPTCDSIDILRKTYRLPHNIRTGDYIEFGLMGAYTNASATRFNGFEPAGTVCVEELIDWTDSKRPKPSQAANSNKLQA